jgi:hypothetical protein
VDELIKKVSEKAGINAEQAKNAVQSVIEFLKAKMPGIGEQVSAMLAGGGGGGGLGEVIGSVRDKFKI